MSRPPWGHISRRCVYCGRVGPRCIVPAGYTHKYCIPRESPNHPDNIRKREQQKESS